MAESVDPFPTFAGAGGYGRYPRRGHYFANAAIALFTFIASCLVLHALLPFPDIAEVTAKLRYFVQHKDEFDTLFVGSSRISRQVIPQSFDRVASEHGVQTHSFNLGVGGMHPPESFYFLDRALRAKPANLRWVFVELEPRYPEWAQDERGTRRFLYWRDWRLTTSMIRQTLHRDDQLGWSHLFGRSSRTARAHLAMGLKNYANIGRTEDLQGWFAMEKQRNSARHDFDQARGYAPQRRTMSTQLAARYSEKLKRSAERSANEFIDPITENGYRDCARQIRRGGASVIFVVPPHLEQGDLEFRPGDEAPGPILAFNANNFPALYDISVRVDANHMTPAGAEMFSRLLAERFVNEAAAR